MKITKNPLFVKSNKTLECKLKLNRREGKENVKHKPAIQKEDRIEKLKSIPFLSFNDFSGLLRRVWFIVTLFWCPHREPTQSVCVAAVVPARMRESKAAQNG